MTLPALLITFFAFLTGNALAHAFSLDLHFGASTHAPNNLRIQQEGYDPLDIGNSSYETRSFSNFSSLAGLTENYYSIRLGYQPKTPPNIWAPGIELELLHDKAYFVRGNDPDGVISHFELSDGLNQVFVNLTGRYAFLPTDAHPSGRLHVLARAGVGPVVTAPATVIRGQPLGTRSHMDPDVVFAIAGPGAQLSAQARYYFTRYTALSLEAKATVAHTLNPIANGYAKATFYGAHVNFGLTISTP